MKKILLCTLSLLLTVSLSGCGSDEEVKKEPSIKKVGIHHIEIVVKDFGMIKAELNGDVAPITVTNFIDL
ncbi:MAG: peptidylprolyl isomerase, partial [Erysipelotrichaceae bacterium]